MCERPGGPEALVCPVDVIVVHHIEREAVVLERWVEAEPHLPREARHVPSLRFAPHPLSTRGEPGNLRADGVKFHRKR